MSYAWLMAPHEYEPDYDAYINEMYLLEDAMIDVGAYDDWFPDLPRPIAAVQQGGPSLIGQPYSPDDERFARLLGRQYEAGRKSGWNDCFRHHNL